MSIRTNFDNFSLLGDTLSRHRGAIAVLITFSLCVNVISFAGPLFSLQVFDRVLNSQSVETLVLLLLITVFLLGLQAFVEGCRSRMLVRLGTRFDEAVSPHIFNCMVQAGIAAPRHAGYANAIRDLDQVRECLSGSPAVAFLDAPWIPLYLGACFVLHPLIGWTVLGCGLALAGLAWINDAVTQGPLRSAQEGALVAAERAAAAHRQGDVVKALGMMNAVQNRWTVSRDATIAWQSLASDRTGANAAATRLIRLLVPVIATAIGGWLVILGEITPGILIASSILAARALMPIDQLVTSWRGVQGARLAWERLRDLEKAAGFAKAPMALPVPAGKLQVMRLVAVPPGSTRPALRNVAFSLDAGDALGVVGPSGSGKSTLARALVGLQAPLAGEIRLDGARIDQWDAENLGVHIGYLPQDSTLMAGSIAENISRFRADATPESVVETAKAADAHEMILELPQGYETLIGVGGEGLSGGQRQRIALARALFGDPAIVVLDEPNAALDSAGEDALLLAVQTLKRRRRTVIIMTHRMGVLGAVNKLLILENGQVRAFGARDEVIATINAEAASSTGRQTPAVVHGGQS